jgi:uridine kinase
MTKLIVGICGGSGSGKTLFLNLLLNYFPDQKMSLLSLDNYYKPIRQQPIDENGIENFDLPESLDREKFFRDLTRLKEGHDVEIEEYTFNNEKTTPRIIRIQAAPIIVVEGIFTFYFKEIRDLLDLKIYIEAPDYLMLTRRITRDATERGYDLNDVLYRFQHHVTPSFKQFIEPVKHDADLIIPNHDGFTKALEVVSAYFDGVLRQ